jgi:hypothetical protein
MTEKCSFRAGPRGAAIPTWRDQLELVYMSCGADLTFLVPCKRPESVFAGIPPQDGDYGQTTFS